MQYASTGSSRPPQSDHIGTIVNEEVEVLLAEDCLPEDKPPSEEPTPECHWSRAQIRVEH